MYLPFTARRGRATTAEAERSGYKTKSPFLYPYKISRAPESFSLNRNLHLTLISRLRFNHNYTLDDTAGDFLTLRS